MFDQFLTQRHQDKYHVLSHFCISFSESFASCRLDIRDLFETEFVDCMCEGLK
jgi:hypothetical protein